MPSPSFCPSRPSMQGRPSSSYADPQHPPLRTQHNTLSPVTALCAIKEPGGCHPEPSCSPNPPCPRLTSRMGAGKGLGDTEPAEPGGNSTDHPPHLYSSVSCSRNKHQSCPSPALARRTGDPLGPKQGELGLGAGTHTQPTAPLSSSRAFGLMNASASVRCYQKSCLGMFLLNIFH